MFETLYAHTQQLSTIVFSLHFDDQVTAFFSETDLSVLAIWSLSISINDTSLF
jgi:hypothetical protein